ncbi:unnamed protein product [Cuscuta epithymum]|uniref:Uncharacterized protein n=1 Tax=Cuscuta epithymum TaxID=186058 RepID=A0AAV0DVW3_9ASTE|nr:unnamed protein product [Cuscuta epithymum]
MDGAAQDMPCVPPPFGQTFPDTWVGIHAHHNAIYRQLSTEQHERFDQMRFEQQYFYREMREDQAMQSCGPSTPILMSASLRWMIVGARSMRDIRLLPLLSGR